MSSTEEAAGSVAQPIGYRKMTARSNSLMLRADMWIYGEESRNEIYRGLISGYTATAAAFVGHERLDNRWGTGGYCGRFSRFRFPSRSQIYREVGRSKLTS